ncbi:MAG TPA: hypothetical protein VMW93_09610, partial [bacterium]|nr:hypothetical protein [bacterium]
IVNKKVSRPAPAAFGEYPARSRGALSARGPGYSRRGVSNGICGAALNIYIYINYIGYKINVIYNFIDIYELLC